MVFDGMDAENVPRLRKGIVEDASLLDVPAADAKLPHCEISLSEHRGQMLQSRLDSIGIAGVNFDGSPPGAGKTHAECEATQRVVARGGKVLVAMPTHANCSEVETQMRSAGLDARSFPRRTDENCQHPDAAAVEALGLPVVSTLCQSCPLLADCQKRGYLAQLQAAQMADVRIATHARVAAAGLAQIAAGCEYVAVHENLTAVLRPSDVISDGELIEVQAIAGELVSDPCWLDHFASGKSEDERRRHAEQLEFAYHFATVAESLRCQLTDAEHSGQLHPASTQAVPRGIEQLIANVCRSRRSNLESGVLRSVLAHASGQLDSMVANVYTSHERGESTERRRLIATRRNDPPKRATIWLSDATSDAGRIASLIGGQVRDCTPKGRVRWAYPPLQVCRDITRTTSRTVARSIVRGIMARFPEARRVGIITHRPLVPAIDLICEPFASRIAATAYFGCGDDRSSNAWHRDCDLLVVLGTPRVPPDAVQAHLIATGKLDAADADGQWGSVAWWGERSGERVPVRSVGYRHPEWAAASRDLVRAAMVQAVGRGRGLLESGIPSVIVTTDECGAVIAPWDIEDIGDRQGSLFNQLLTAAGGASIRTETLIGLLGKVTGFEAPSERSVRRDLQSLEVAGLAVRSGKARATAWSASPAWRASGVTSLQLGA